MLRACLQLLRPANVATALADVLAGFAIAGLGNRAALPWLLLATAALYAGGIVLNDVFDREVDRLERPERPIPSGRIRTAHAAALGAGLLVARCGRRSRGEHDGTRRGARDCRMRAALRRVGQAARARSPR